MAKPKTSRTPRKRTAHVDDASKPGTVLNVETNLLIAKGKTISDLSELKTNTQARVRKINEGFNKEFTKAQDKEHVNKRAANIAFGLATLEDEELHETLYHLFFYIKDLGLLERAKKQEELFSASETGPGLNGSSKSHPDDQSQADGDEHEDGEHQDETSATSRTGAAARDVEAAAGDRPH